MHEKSITDFVGMAATYEDLGFEYLLIPEKRTWEEARGGCVDRGYGLAKIESAEEFVYIRHLIISDECKDYFFSINPLICVST